MNDLVRRLQELSEEAPARSVFSDAADEIERLTAENSVLRESIDDFLSQIEDCESAHTVCSQLTLLSKVVLQNTTNAASTQQEPAE